MISTTKNIITALGDGLELGPDLSDQEWQEALEIHRQAKAEELKMMSPDDEHFVETERAAAGLFWSDAVGRIQ
jgi:hypothetical protein